MTFSGLPGPSNAAVPQGSAEGGDVARSRAAAATDDAQRHLVHHATHETGERVRIARIDVSLWSNLG